MRKSIRFLCLLLCLTFACAAALAADDYTLPEKMSMQVKSGSGVKGAVSVAVAGGSEWLNVLLPFTGANLQIRYIEANGQFQGQLYALDDQEQQRALTQVYGDDTHLYLRSDLLPDKVFTLPFGGALMEQIFGSDGKNPTFYTVVQELMSLSDEEWEKNWNPALAPYEAALEQWLMDYAADPSISQTGDGASNMTLSYIIPGEALKLGMKDLISQVLRDEALTGLLKPILTKEQAAVYLNPSLEYYYDYIIDELPLDGELRMVRTLSTKGDLISSSLTLPLPENDGGWDNLICEITDRNTTFTLDAENQSVTFVTQESATADDTTWNGVFRYMPAQGTPLSAAFSLTKTFSTYRDEEDATRTHEVTKWTLTARQDLNHLKPDDPTRGDYLDFEDITLSLTTHYHSREQRNDATTLEAKIYAELPALAVELNATLRTASPWVFSDLPTEGAESLLTMTPETAADLLAEFSRNAALTMTSLISRPAATEEPAATDPAEPTLVPPAQ